MFQRGYDWVSGIGTGIVGAVSKSVNGRGGVIQVVYVIGLTALMAGFVNAIITPVPNQGVIIYAGTGSEAIPEAVINSLVILLGGVGIYLVYLSGRQTTNPRNVNLYLMVALLLIAVSIITGIDIANLKGY